LRGVRVVLNYLFEVGLEDGFAIELIGFTLETTSELFLPSLELSLSGITEGGVEED